LDCSRPLAGLLSGLTEACYETFIFLDMAFYTVSGLQLLGDKMRYRKTIEMTTENIAALENGTLVLQCGQWVRFGSTLSRYVGRTAAGSLWMAHSSRPDKTIFNMEKFQRMNQRFKNMNT